MSYLASVDIARIVRLHIETEQTIDIYRIVDRLHSKFPEAKPEALATMVFQRALALHAGAVVWDRAA